MAAKVEEVQQEAVKVVPAASLTFKDLAFETTMPDRTSKTILSPCSGHCEAGELVAIMGPSGSGKSTLLDMLAMKKTAPYSGEVWVNGQPRDSELFPRIAAYVGQDDHMPEHWKVREALEFSSTLKQPASQGNRAAKKAARARTDHLLEVFGLVEVATTYVGGPQVRGISGGQRKRTSLARGVAAQASILFADEPTSGLSATDAEACVRALRRIAKEQGVLVLINIHQPRREVAAMFDTLILLTPTPGRIVYSGPMSESSAYMAAQGYPVPQHGNATDFFLDLVTPGSDCDAAEALAVSFEKNMQPALLRRVEEESQRKGQTIAEMIQSTSGSTARCFGAGKPGSFAVPFRLQFQTLIARKLRITLRNPAAIGTQLVMPTVMGVVLGSVFQGIGHGLVPDENGVSDFGIPQLMFVFILLTMLSLQSLPLMPTLIEERLWSKEETSERLYKESAQILATSLVTVPLSLIGATIQTLIIYSFAQLPLSLLPTIVGWTLMVFFAFDALFQCMAAIAPDGEQALMFATPWLVVFMLFNGLVVAKASAPVFLRWIFAVSPTFFALQSIVTRMADEADQPDSIIVSSLGYKAGEDFHGILVICAMNLVLRVGQVFAMKFCNNIQK